MSILFKYRKNQLLAMLDPYFTIFSAEILFTIIAVVFCFVIYFKTRESYELTKYEGIRYFREAFLCLGLSYVLRFLFSLTFISRMTFDFILNWQVFMPLFIMLLSYFSTIGIFLSHIKLNMEKIQH